MKKGIRIVPAEPIMLATGFVPLETVSKFVRGVTYKKEQASSLPREDRIPILRANNIGARLNLDTELIYVDSTCVRQEQELKDGDVVIAMSSGSKAVVGKTAQLNSDWRGSFGAFCGVLRPNRFVNTRYFGLFFQTKIYRDEASRLSSGTNINNLKPSSLKEIPFPWIELERQKKVVDRLDTLLPRMQFARKGIEGARQKINQLRRAVLAAACSGRLTSDWRGDEEIANEIPSSWKWMLVKGIAEVRGGIQKQPHRRPNKNSFPYLRVANVKRNILDLSEIVEFELQEGELEKYRLMKGDMLVVEGNGSPTEIGRSAIWNDEIPNCVHQNHIIRVRFNQNICIPEYANYFWNSPLGSAEVAAVAVTTSGLYSLSTKKIAAIKIPVPPIEEQHEIARRVRSYFDVANRVERSLIKIDKECDSASSAILRSAFNFV